MRKILFAVFLFGLAIISPASASNKPADREIVSIPIRLLMDMAVDKTRDKYLARLLHEFRGPAGDDQILNLQELEDETNRLSASHRASRFEKLLQYDLNADGDIVRDEVVAVLNMKNSSEGMLLDQTAVIAAIDADEDGKVTFSEALAYFKNDITTFKLRYDIRSRIEILFSLDPNKDGRLAADEVEGIGRATFARFDTNDYGILSDEERITLDQLKNEFVRGQKYKWERQRSKSDN